MSDMLAFCTGMLTAVGDFLGSEPMIYLFGFLLVPICIRGIQFLTKGV